MHMGKGWWRRKGELSPETKQPKDAQDDLVFYLVVRFVAVLVVVMAAESLVVWFESRFLLPTLLESLNVAQGAGLQQTGSFFALLRWVILLIWSATTAQYVQVASLARRSLVALIALGMLVLLAAPVLVGAVVTARMVARKMRALQEQRERELAMVDRQRSQFMTDIAHDLRTPLMAISGMSHAILDGVARDDATRTQYLQAICDKADKMSGLVSSVFDYAKLGSGSFSLERKQIDLPQLLLQEAAVAYPDVEEAGMHFSIEVPEDRCLVFADPLQLARIVANLLTNAVRHNEPGAEIALMLVRQAGVAYVMVADTGEPIPGNPDDLFQPFSRGDMARSSSGGTGLGLSICKRIANMHGYGLALAQPYGRFAKAFVLRCTVVG